jgi:beta-lactamase class A
VPDDLQAAVDGLPDRTPGVRWGVCVRDVGTGRVLASRNPDHPLPTASVGKLLLLIEVARRIEAGHLDAGELLRRTPEDAVADSGLWQHLRVDALPVADLAVLVGSVSDNLATNVLLRHVGLEPVAAVGRDLGLTHTRLHDAVRDRRGPEHPPTLSTGTAGELAALLAACARGEALSPRVSAQLLDWLAGSADTSMVAAALHLDPLAHVQPDRGLLLRHKTGTDDGIRADVGLLRGHQAGISYAVCARWEPSQGTSADARGTVLEAMAELGRQLLRIVN